MKENYQKIKLLKLMELLRQETDELHALSTNEICSRLSAIGISCERRTLAKDIALLNEQGFEVNCRIFPFINREINITANGVSELSEPYVCHSCFGEPDENGFY